MSHSLVEARKHRPGRIGHMGGLVILPDELPHRVERIKPHDRREFDLPIQLAAHHVDVPKARDGPGLDPRNDGAPEQPLISLRILEGMEASWDYVRRLTQRSEETGWDLTLIAELNLNDIGQVESTAAPSRERPWMWLICWPPGSRPLALIDTVSVR